jgi:DNA-binding transcriptional LysR family regulator
MEINHLRIIQTLVADPHLTRAAERLHITQSALSKRVQQIESELGTQLFERRGPRGLSPLPQAHELANVADRMLTTWDAGLRRLLNLSDEPQHFTLVGPQVFLREIVLPWWRDVGKEFSELQLEVKISNLTRVSVETVQSGADAGILEHREELGDYVCKPLYTERWGVVRHIDSPAGNLEKFSWGTYSPQENPVETWLVSRQKMTRPRYRIVWQDFTALAVWCADNPGCATVAPWHAVRWLVKRGRVAFDPIPNANTSLYLAYPKSNPHKRFLRELLSLGERTSRENE